MDIFINQLSEQRIFIFFLFPCRCKVVCNIPCFQELMTTTTRRETWTTKDTTRSLLLSSHHELLQHHWIAIITTFIITFLQRSPLLSSTCPACHHLCNMSELQTRVSQSRPRGLTWQNCNELHHHHHEHLPFTTWHQHVTNITIIKTIL